MRRRRQPQIKFPSHSSHSCSLHGVGYGATSICGISNQYDGDYRMNGVSVGVVYFLYYPIISLYFKDCRLNFTAYVSLISIYVVQDQKVLFCGTVLTVRYKICAPLLVFILLQAACVLLTVFVWRAGQNLITVLLSF